MALQTEIDFSLPKGLMEEDGTLHKDGKMRLATAADEILPLKDPRVQQNPSYLTIIVMSRVISKLGNVPHINPGIIEKLYASDLSYLQELYQTMNSDGNGASQAVCPNCEHKFTVHSNGLEEV